MNLWQEARRTVVPVIAIGGVIWATLQHHVEPLRDDVRRITEKMDQITDPLTGYPEVIRQSIKDGFQLAIREDEMLRFKVSTEFNKNLTDAIANNNNDFERRHRELVALIKAQTRQHTTDINRLEGQLVVVKNFQEVIARRHQKEQFSKGIPIQQDLPKPKKILE